MSLSKKLFPRSLKNRIAIGYAVLFFISSAVILAACIWLINSRLDKTLERSAVRIATRTAELHLLGRRLGSFTKILPGSAFPENERQILEKKFPGIVILFTGFRAAGKAAGTKQGFFTAFALHEKNIFEMRLPAPNGFFSKRILPEHNKGSLIHYFSQLILNRGQENFVIAIFNHDDSLYLESSKNAISHAEQRLILAGPANCRTGEFRYSRFELPDGRKLVIGFSRQQEQEWFATIALLTAAVLLTMTAFGSIAAWLLTRHFIRGIKETTLAMNRISSGDYSFRLRESTDHDREIRELTTTFNAMNERTENLLQEIRMVSDNVAHDLRTPLTRIYGTVELLLTNRELPEKFRNDCSSIAEEIIRLKELVNTIMEISRTNSVPGTLHLENMDIAAVTRDFCDFMQIAFEEKHLEFTVELPDEAILIRADKKMFQRLLSNLLSNALKFTDKGFTAVKLAHNGKTVTLAVADSGCGISENDQQHVFKRFFRSDESRHLQGNGLGLALVEAIVKAHNWQISLASSPGEGSVFTITIPV